MFLSPAAQLGGAEAVLLELLRSLRETRSHWSLHVIAAEDGPLLGKVRSMDISVDLLPFPPSIRSFGENRRPASMGVKKAAGSSSITAKTKRIVEWGRAGIGVFRYGWKLRSRLAALAPAVVHTNGMKMHLLGALARPKPSALIWHLHDYLGSRAAMKPLLRCFSSRCALVIANSRSVADDVRAVLSDGPPVEAVYNTVNLEVFNPRGPRLDLDALAGMSPPPPGTVRIGLVATFALWKGHEIFLRAAAETTGPKRFYVVGGQMYATADSQRTTEELRALADSLGMTDRVGFTGFVDDAASAMRALDIVVHASTEPEPFGLVIVQALGCARATIISAAGGAKELIEPEVTALSHSPGNVDELKVALDRLSNDLDLRARLGEAGRLDMAKRFGHERLAREVVPLYERVATHSQ